MRLQGGKAQEDFVQSPKAIRVEGNYNSVVSGKTLPHGWMYVSMG